MKNKKAQSKGNEYFQKAREEAKNMAGDPGRLENLIQEALNKIKNFSQKNKKTERFIRQIYTLKRMIRAYIHGEYQNLPWKTLLTLIAGLIYFVTPMDLIPDFIPVTGFIDDATILLWIFHSFKEDIENFEIWEQDFSKREG